MSHPSLMRLIQYTLTENSDGNPRHLWLVLELCDKGPLEVRTQEFAHKEVLSQAWRVQLF